MESFLRGVGVALITPFKSDKSVDFDALENLADYVIAGGVDYLVALGTTAETPTLTHPERAEVVRTLKKRINGRVPLVIGIGGNNTAAVVSCIEEFDLSGAAGLLSVTPFYNKPSQRGLYEHYKEIAKVSPVPVIVYNVPGRTGVNMTAETTLRLAHDVKNIKAVKEACGDISQVEEIIKGRPEGFSVLAGDDHMALPLIKHGGDGVISVAANAFPAAMKRLAGLAFDKQYEKADEQWSTLCDMVDALFAEGNPTGVKAALVAKGLIDNVLRLPLVECSPELYSDIVNLISKYDL